MLMRIERNLAVEEGVLVQVGAVVRNVMIRPRHKFLLQLFRLQMVRLRMCTIKYVPCHETFGSLLFDICQSIYGKLVFTIAIVSIVCTLLQLASMVATLTSLIDYNGDLKLKPFGLG